MPSPIAWPAKSWGIALSFLIAIGAALAMLVPALLYYMTMISVGQVDMKHPMANLSVLLTAQVVTYLPAALYLAAVLPAISKVNLAYLGLRMPTPRDVAIALAGAVVMWIAVAIAGAIVLGITHSTDTETAIALLKSLKTPGEQINFFIVAVVLAPLVEELTFRVFLFNAISRYLPIGAALVISGIIFGAVHAASASQLISVSIPLAVGGFVLAYVYALTRNYWSSVITHCLFNSVSVIAVLVFHVKQ